jgi:hypothetical protein
MSARQFGRDSGDMYGRHALVNPGGDNRQIDVLALVLGHPHGYVFNPTRLSDDYVGSHRASWWDAQVDR